MAFEIATPDVGSRLLKTFGAISEENRANRLLESRIEQAEASIAAREMANTIREKALGIQQQRADQSYLLGGARLDLQKLIEQRHAEESGVKMNKLREDADATSGDRDSRNQVSSLLNTPDETGKTLHQRMWSADEKEAKEARDAYANLASRFAAAGKLTQQYLNDIDKRFRDQKGIDLAAEREARMAETAAANADRADRSLDERSKQGAARVGAAATRADQQAAQAKLKEQVDFHEKEIASRVRRADAAKKASLSEKNPVKKAELETIWKTEGYLANEYRKQLAKLVGVGIPSLGGPELPQPDGAIDIPMGATPELIPGGPTGQVAPEVLPTQPAPISQINTPAAQNGLVPVINPSGKAVKIRESQLQDALQRGYRQSN
jgi:hypothetical protein